MLDVPQIGIDDDFFRMGGDSIRVMMLQNECTDLKLSTRMIYDCRTPRKLAGKLSEAGPETDILLPGEIPAEPVPLTQTQLGICLESEKREGEAAYNNPMLFRLPADTDAGRLSEAVSTAFKAHPALFVRIATGEDGMPAMQYEPAFAEQEICGIVSLTEKELAEQKNTLVQPFLIRKDRLFRCRLYKTEEALHLFMDFHHIIFDGTSMHILFADIEKAFRGEAVKTEEYTAFHAALDEQRDRSSEVYQKAAAWYRKAFEDFEEVSLPSGDKAEDKIRFAAFRYPLSAGAEKLRSFCEENRITENVFTTAAFGYLLSSYTMNKNAVFAAYYNGRHDLRTNRTVSMFVKTLPVLCRIKDGMSVKDYLQEIKQQMLGSMANDIYSFADAASQMGMTSDVLFTYQGDIFDVPELDGIRIEREELSFNATGEPLSVQLLPENDTLTLDIQYHGNRFSEDYIRQLARCYDQVFNRMLAENCLTGIPLLDTEREQEILALSKGEDLAYDKGETWIDLFRSWVQKTPDSTAVVDSKGSYTYRELDQASDSIAAGLLNSGVKENSFVAVRMDRVKEFIAAVIGVQKAGAAYVPVDPDYPADRIAYILDDSESPLELTDRSAAEILEKYAGAAPVNLASPDHLAYMIYTSGSTGRPKGVMISHRSLRAYVAWSTRDFGYETDGRYAHSVSFSFDASVTDIVCPLSVGAQTHVLSYEVRQNIGMLYDYLEHFRIMGVKFPTQLGMLMLNTYPDLPISFTVLGGEKLLPCARTDVKMFNEYGPTEFTIGSTVHVVDQDVDEDIPIGRAVPNSWSVVCDRQGNLVPRGMTGELCLVGDQIAEGYWKRPDLTEEKFCDCPFLPGRKMYRTGDLARYNEAGVAECLGRIDTQVKIRGFRVELGEIEARASQFEGILHVAAEVKKDQLVLYYTSHKPVNEEELRAFLAQSLADFMVPSVYMRLETMPMTPAGKISRRELPEPETDLHLKNEPPRNVQEALLLEFARRIFGRDDFGVTDSFSLLGLNSLQAMRIVAEAEERRIRIKVNDLMKHDTIRKLVDAHMTVCYQEGKYDPALPTVVMVCGITSYRNLGSLSDALKDKVNLFVVEPIKSHYHMIFKGEKMEDVISFYGTFLDYILDGRKVDAFLGHCYGGELAFRLAAWWQKDHPGYLNTFLLDSPWNEKEDKATSTFFSMLPAALTEGQLKWEKVEHGMITDLIQPGRPHMNGRVVFFEAGQAEERNVRAFEVLSASQRILVEKLKRKQEEEQGMTVPEIYRSMSDDYVYVRVEGSHVGMLSPQFVPVYTDYIMRYLDEGGRES